MKGVLEGSGVELSFTIAFEVSSCVCVFDAMLIDVVAGRCGIIQSSRAYSPSRWKIARFRTTSFEKVHRALSPGGFSFATKGAIKRGQSSRQTARNRGRERDVGLNSAS